MCARIFFNDVEPINNMYRRRQLLFLIRLVRLGRDKCALTMLTTTTKGKRLQDRLHKTIRDAMIDMLQNIIPHGDDRGKVEGWIR